MNDVIFNTLKEKDFIVKNYLFKVASELNLSLNEVILLIYFTNQEYPSLNLEGIKSSTYLKENDIMEAFTRLVGINLISVSVEKLPNGNREEVINLDNIIKNVVSDISKKYSNDLQSDLFSKFEEEFARPLSTMEYEIINNWIKKGISEELILEALKEATFNGVKGSLRYIDKILVNWNDLGYKNKKDIESSYKNDSLKKDNQELFDYNWLDEE